MRHSQSIVLSLVLLLASLLPATCLAQEEKPLTRIAFGSCAHQDQKQPIWDAIVETNPDLFLFVGDNIYGDTEDMDIMRAKYDKLAAQKGYKKLTTMCPILATWDDHDFGLNDGGKEFTKKKESQQVFLDFFQVPEDSPRRKQEGVYHAQMFGPASQRVQVIMLDTRYFRDALKKRNNAPRGVGPYVVDESPDKTILGEAQWVWLKEQLQKPALVRLIVSSIQVVPEDHGWEKWMNIAKERERLFQLIRDTKAEGVIFLSGDRHLAELSMMDGGVGYPMYDLTSSGLNRGAPSWRKLEANRHRVATMPFGDNFGLITIDWSQVFPQISMQIRDTAGDIVIQHKIPLTVLSVGKLAVGGTSGVTLASGEKLSGPVLEKHLNKEVTVHFKVGSSGMSKAKGLIFLNSAKDYRADDNFTVVLKTGALEGLKKAGIEDVRAHFSAKQIAVTGTLKLYQEKPEIIVERAEQISIRKAE